MPHLNVRGGNSPGAIKPRTAAAVAVLIACIGLAACGGSSKGTSTSTNAASATSTAQGAPTGSTGPGGGPAGAAGGRFKAVRECLQKNGITLPRRTPGAQRPPGAGGLLGAGGGPQLPKGVTRGQYEAALKKCGGLSASRGAFGRGTRFRSPAFKQALAKFATCMRENGVKVPEPNTSGKGPVFNSTGLNTASAQFRTANAKCGGVLNALRGRPGAGGIPGGPAGAPGGTTPSE